jgi:hypothetical protein
MKWFNDIFGGSTEQVFGSGSVMNTSDGDILTRSGNFMNSSDGTTYTKMGNTWYGNDGSMKRFGSSPYSPFDSDC